MLTDAILELIDSVTMYLGLTHSTVYGRIKKKVDLEFLFLLHVNDGDRCGGFGNTAIKKLS